jgi:polyribonucleotide nucleotidyltransferase
MKKNRIDDSLRSILKGSNVPVLILDTRWHRLFPPEEKPDIIRHLESALEDVIKEQGKLVNEIKELKHAKKKVMDGVIASIGVSSDRKSKKSKELILEMTERIDYNTERLMELPYQIKDANYQLLVAGVKICYERMKDRRQELEELELEVNTMREILKSKVAYKVQLEEEKDNLYSIMHDIMGPRVTEIFDHDMDIED